MYPELYKCNSRESAFVNRINLYDENNFIDSLGPGRDSNPDPLVPKQCKSQFRSTDKKYYNFTKCLIKKIKAEFALRNVLNVAYETQFGQYASWTVVDFYYLWINFNKIKMFKIKKTISYLR
jgi:hypothetical protein